jgi:hypothetical protein
VQLRVQGDCQREIGRIAIDDRGRRPTAIGPAKGACRLAEQNDLAYEYEYTPAFAKRQRLLSPEQYEVVEVRISRGVSRVMLFSKAIVQAEGDQCTAKRGHDCEP